jgi:capsular polysaccharide export protein
LLQGPIGSFFKRLALYLEGNGSTVYKVNFNPGDDLFYPANSERVIQYQYRIEYWPGFATKLISDKKIEAVFLFGDCRPVHKPICSICKALNIDVIVFEEGYLRPNFFTMEYSGVNYFSRISQLTVDTVLQDIEAYHQIPEINFHYKKSYENMVRQSIKYWFANLLPNTRYVHYDHHRTLDILRGLHWVRNFFRYWLYFATEKSLKDKLLTKTFLNGKDQSYFLLPLQVFDDAQITQHSNYSSIENLVEDVITSFSKHILESQRNDVLIIKHHPMDRGHVNYGIFIQKLTSILNVRKQVIYIHDIEVQTLLTKITGCITVNSTLGLLALSCNIPTINLGKSIYNKSGLTYQGDLDSFWKDQVSVDQKTVRAFLNYLIRHTQVNGCLYSEEYQMI